jgi:hypothetical protein
MKTFREFIIELTYRSISKEKEKLIKKQITAAKKSEKEASNQGDFDTAARHNQRQRAMRDRKKISDLPY